MRRSRYFLSANQNHHILIAILRYRSFAFNAKKICVGKKENAFWILSNVWFLDLYLCLCYLQSLFHHITHIIFSFELEKFEKERGCKFYLLSRCHSLLQTTTLRFLNKFRMPRIILWSKLEREILFWWCRLIFHHSFRRFLRILFGFLNYLCYVYGKSIFHK